MKRDFWCKLLWSLMKLKDNLTVNNFVDDKPFICGFFSCIEISQYQMPYSSVILWPSVSVAFDSEEIDEPVEIWLKVFNLHADEAEQISLEPGTHIVDKSHVFKIFSGVLISLIDFGFQRELLDQPVMGFFAVMNDRWTFYDVILKSLIYPLGRWLAMPADTCIGVLVDIDGCNDTDEIFW